MCVCVCVCVSPGFSYVLLVSPASLLALCVSAEQEVENLSGLSPNPDRDIFVVRENGTTCLMAEFAVKFLIPYDVLALNGIDVSNSKILNEAF